MTPMNLLAVIASAVISGNTTMIHLLLGLNPDYIRLDPYTPTLKEIPELTAEEMKELGEKYIAEYHNLLNQDFPSFYF